MYVYLAGPITGVSAGEAQDWRNGELLRSRLKEHDWQALSPFDGIFGYAEQAVEEVEDGGKIPGWFEDKVDGEGAALKAFHKDLRYIRESAAVLANFTGSKHASIGTCVELGYAHALGKPIISVIASENNVHDHPFVIGVSYSVVPTLLAAVAELVILGSKLREPAYA